MKKKKLVNYYEDLRLDKLYICSNNVFSTFSIFCILSSVLVIVSSWFFDSGLFSKELDSPLSLMVLSDEAFDLTLSLLVLSDKEL